MTSKLLSAPPHISLKFMNLTDIMRNFCTNAKSNHIIYVVVIDIYYYLLFKTEIIDWDNVKDFKIKNCIILIIEK